MARRRGRFARSRRGNSNLSALVAQLLREQRAAEDRAIFDAYNNGGLYKGKPVTDDVILKYIKQRRDGFDTQDPLYDEWNNRLIQTKFIIGEQKIGLAYKQGKVGAGAVAAYYRNALKSIPKNSAFYRDVAGRAAEWAKGAARAASGRARGRATAPLRAKLNQQLEDQNGYLSLEAGITAYAKAQGLISGTQTLADADASELLDMFSRGLYAGDKQITWADFVRSARGYYGAVGDEIRTRLQLGQQAVEARNKRSKFLNEKLVKLNVMDEREQYEKAREVWMDARSAAGEDPYANAAADAAYAQALKGIYANVQPGTSKYSEDPEFAGGLSNEYDLLTTGKAPGKTVSDLYDYQGPGSKEMADGYEAIQNDIKMLNSGKAYLGQSEPGGPIHVVQWQTGLGKDPLGLDDSLQPSIDYINGQKRLVYLKGKAVTASIVVDRDGNPVDPRSVDPVDLINGLRDETYQREDSKNPVGYVFTTAQGNIKYGVVDKATGKMVFTSENPWSSDVVNVGGNLTVFGGAYQDQRGQWRPDVNAALDATKPPPSLQTADPVLADGTVAPSDLQSLVDNGDLNMSPEDIAAYQYKLATQPQAPNSTGGPDERQRVDLSDMRAEATAQHQDALNAGITQEIRAKLGVGFDAAHHTTPQAPPALKPPPLPAPIVFNKNDQKADDQGLNAPPSSVVKPPPEPTPVTGTGGGNPSHPQ